MQHAGYFNGKFVHGEGQTLRVDNPSDTTELASFPGLTPSDFDAAVRAASAARLAWGSSGARERAAALLRRRSRPVLSRSQPTR